MTDHRVRERQTAIARRAVRADVRLAAVLSIVAALAASCGGSAGTAARRVTTATGHRQGTTVPPAGSVIARIVPTPWSSTVRLLATKRGERGVWAWNVGADKAGGTPEARIWHYDATSDKTTSWSIGGDADVLGGIAAPALAACSEATWFGSNRTLVSLDPSTGTTKRFTVPPTEVVAQADSAVPVGAPVRSGITGLACDDAHSLVAIALSNATSALVFHTDTKAFTSVPLPANTSAMNVASDGDGHAAIGLQSYGPDGIGHPSEVLLVDLVEATSKSVAVADSMQVHAGTDGFIAGDTMVAQVISPTSGVVRPAGSASGKPTADPSIGAGQVLPDGRRVVASDRGIRLIDPAHPDAAVDVSLGRVPCVLGSTPYGAAMPTTTEGETCRVLARVIVVDDHGDVFIVPSTGSPTPVDQVIVPPAS